MQRKQSEEQHKSSEGLESLKEKFNQEKSHVIETDHPRYRKVRLTHYQSCGCGLEDIEIDREVPYDSPYQDGDRVTELEEADEIVVN